MGIIDFGRIGQEVAKCAYAFGMNRRVCPGPDPATKQLSVVSGKLCEVNTLVSQSDVVSVDCPVTPKTGEMINANRLAEMKPSPFFSNASDGPFVDEKALPQTLHTGCDAGVGPDAIVVEPPQSDDPLLNTAKQRGSPYVCVGLVLLVILLFALVRFRLRAMPLERDEGEYAYAGQLILQGIPPYQLVYSMKLPGTHAAYALVLAIFGQTPSGIHLGLILINAATTLLVFLLAARLFGGLAGVVAAASYGLLSTSPSVNGLAAHATHFVVLAAITGILLLLQAIDSNRVWLFFCSGLVLGLAFLMKQPGIAFLVFAGLYLVKCKLQAPARWKDLVLSTVALALGGALPFGITCLIMLKAGVFHTFWFWTFVYAREYSSEATSSDAFALFRMAVPYVTAHVALIWVIAGVGLTAFAWSAHARSHAFLVSSFLLISLLAVCPGFYFRPHYFVLALPAVALLAGMAVSCATQRFSASGGRRRVVFIPAFLFLIAFSYSVFQQRELFFQMDPVAAIRSVYPGNPFPEAIEVAKFIKGHAPEGARIAVLGSEPEIYFYSHRHSATGYIYTYPLMEPQEYASKMQKEMIAEIESARPEYLVYIDMPCSWSPMGEDWSIFGWILAYTRTNYQLVGVDHGVRRSLNIEDGPNIFAPLTTLNVYVFKRKAS
jgi:hypothetical protein